MLNERSAHVRLRCAYVDSAYSYPVGTGNAVSVGGQAHAVRRYKEARQNGGSMPKQRSLAMIEELANDHAAYARVDLTSQVKILHDTVEDMMMRLEEFESIFGMIQTDGAECLSGQIPRLQTARQELRDLCRRIDALEHVVARANVNLVSLEAAVDAAEADLGVPDSLFSKLNPLSFFKKVQEPTACTRIPAFDPPMIYKTEEFFNPE